MNAKETINEVTKEDEAEKGKAVFQVFSLTKDDFLKHAPTWIKDKFLSMTDDEQIRFLSLFVDEMRDAFVNEFLPYWKKVMDEVFCIDKEDMDDLFGQALMKPKAEQNAAPEQEVTDEYEIMDE